MTLLTTKLTNKSGASIEVTLKDEASDNISASFISNLKWSLYDADDAVINSRSDVVVTPIANPFYVTLTASDTDNADGLKRKLVVTFDADTSLGDDIAQEQTIIFEIEGDADEAVILDVENNLITLTQLQTYLNVSTADGYDDRLEDIINAVSEFCNTYTGRKLKARNLVEYYDGDGGDELYVDNPPINSTRSTIQIWGDTDVPRSYDTADLYSADSIDIYSDLGKIILLDDSFLSGRKTIKVSYNGGYTVIPYQLQRVALKICAALWKTEVDKLAGVRTIAGGGGSINLDIESVLTQFDRDVLDTFKRIKI